MTYLRRLTPAEISSQTSTVVSEEVMTRASEIVSRVRHGGVQEVRALASQFNERTSDQPLVLSKREMQDAADKLDPDDRAALERAAERIKSFAEAQRDAIQPLTINIPGASCGHTIEPVRNAGCYAPAGRYPLPSSVLMTAITARAAGCERVVVGSPGANPVTLAAAHIAGVDEFLAIGGAHAIASFAYGFENFERVDVIAGPGNAYVTAAKQLVSADVGIDMLAGPSELLVLCDESADPALVAADLLAQAEHDTDAIPTVVSTSAKLLEAIEAQLDIQLHDLPTSDTARVSLKNGFAVLCDSIDQAIETTDTIAPEHLEVMTEDSETVSNQIRNAGAVFIGARSAEVIGDYGLGPNHTLPTGGTARFQSGLSIMHFIRLRTWIRVDNSNTVDQILDDTQRLARMEGLIAHERAAFARSETPTVC